MPLDAIGTDPARSLGISDRAVEHYNATWFGEGHPVDTERVGYQAPPLDGIWASAPYLHNGSVPTLHALLKSSTRPGRFSRPPSTDFEHYDTRQVGWKFHELTDAEIATMKTLPTRHTSSMTRPASAWATAATRSGTSCPKIKGWT